MKECSAMISWRTLNMLALFLILVTTSCSTMPVTTNDVFIRVKNKTQLDIRDLTFGKRIIKKDSYSNINYTTEFRNIQIGDTTKYVATRGKHLAFTGLRIHAKPNVLMVNRTGAVQALIKKIGGTLDTMAHPYTGQSLSGYVLPKGHYTFTFVNISDQLVFTLYRNK